eukprot:scaffold655_cov225-Pinguiococcus_pyrenoidosus.AAC.2
MHRRLSDTSNCYVDASQMCFAAPPFPTPEGMIFALSFFTSVWSAAMLQRCGLRIGNRRFLRALSTRNVQRLFGGNL